MNTGRGDFVHLHVASGFSMRYGTATPEALVERAAQHGQPVLALTDRDGLYGAVRFVVAATAAGIAEYDVEDKATSSLLIVFQGAFQQGAQPEKQKGRPFGAVAEWQRK